MGYAKGSDIWIFDAEAPSSNKGHFIHGLHAFFDTKASGVYLAQEGLSGSKVGRGTEIFPVRVGSKILLKHGDIITFGSDLKNPSTDYNYLSYELCMPNGETYGTGPRTNPKKRARVSNTAEEGEEQSASEVKRISLDGNQVDKVVQKAVHKAFRKASRNLRLKQVRQSKGKAGQRAAAAAAAANKKSPDKKRKGKGNRFAAGQVAHKRKIKTKGGCTLAF